MTKFLIIATFIVLTFYTERTYACSCSETPLHTSLEMQVKDAFEYSNAIFSGEVITIKRHLKSDFDLLIKFKIENSWKGKSVKTLTIITANSGTACGYQFEIGKKYLVYANGKQNGLGTSICSRTYFLNNNDDIKVLDRIKKKA